MTASVVRKPSMVAMLGAIMPQPLAARPSRTCPRRAAREGGRLGARVSGHDGRGEVGRRRRRRAELAAAAMPGPTLHRQRHADDAGRGHGDLPRAGEGVGGQRPHARRVPEALVAGAGVGVARVDDHGAQAPARRRAAREPHRRRRRGVRGEQDRRGAGHGRAEDADIAPAAALEAGVQAGGLEAAGWLTPPAGPCRAASRNRRRQQAWGRTVRGAARTCATG